MGKNNLAESPASAEILNRMQTLLENWMKDQDDQRKVYGKPTLVSGSL